MWEVLQPLHPPKTPSKNTSNLLHPCPLARIKRRWVTENFKHIKLPRRWKGQNTFSPPWALPCQRAHLQSTVPSTPRHCSHPTGHGGTPNSTGAPTVITSLQSLRRTDYYVPIQAGNCGPCQEGTDQTEVHGSEATDTGLGRNCPTQALQEGQVKGHQSGNSFTASTAHCLLPNKRQAGWCFPLPSQSSKMQTPVFYILLTSICCPNRISSANNTNCWVWKVW